MEGLGILGDLPQRDPLPSVGGNHDNASHTHDDRVNSFGDLPHFDQLPAVGSNHTQALQIRADGPGSAAQRGGPEQSDVVGSKLAGHEKWARE